MTVCWYGSKTEKRPKIRFLQYWRYYIVICYESLFIGKIQLLVQMQEMPIIIYGRSNYDGKTKWGYMNLVEWIMQVRLAPIVNQHLQIELWKEVEKNGIHFSYRKWNRDCHRSVPFGWCSICCVIRFYWNIIRTTTFWSQLILNIWWSESESNVHILRLCQSLCPKCA